MRREQSEAYRDQFEFLADCFELIRRRGDAFNIRSEALEVERMARYSARSGFESERSHLLEIYRDIEAEAARLESALEERKRRTEAVGVVFPLDHFAARHRLHTDELAILLVLLYNESVGRSQTRFQTGNEILNLLYPNPVSALKASRHLDAGGALMREGLIRTTGDEDTVNFLRASYEVTELTLQEVLGVRNRDGVPQAQQLHHAAPLGPDSPVRAVSPRVSLDDVALPGDLRLRVEELLWQIEQGDGLLREWGIQDVLEKGRGTVLLFSGPPGTGKTMTAEAMAHRLARPLYVVDYSQVESKWIGETEKNIVALFRAAESSGALLLIDEADSILSGRLDGGHYNDRAYNRQVSLLLTELEAFEGVCVLTTNRECQLDEGLARRIAARLEFPVPGAEERLRIWRRLLPAAVPLAADVDLPLLAERFVLSGGHIKNAVLAAVRQAARRDGRTARVTQADFLAAAARERTTFARETKPIGFQGRPGDNYL